MFFKKAKTFDEIFTVDSKLCSKFQIDAVKISSVFVAFLENMNFKISSDEDNNNPKITL